MKSMKTAGVLFAVLLVLGGIATWDEWQTDKDAEQAKEANLLFPDGLSDVVRIDYRRATEDADESEVVSFALEKKGDDWYIEQPLTEKADQMAVKNFLKAFREYRFAKKIPAASTEFSDFGVAEDAARQISFEDTQGRKKILYIGTDAAVGYQAYMRFSDAEDVLMGSQHIRVFTHKTLFDLRDKAVFTAEFSQIHSLTYEAKAQPAIRLEKVGDGWRMTNPVEDDADVRAIEDFIGEFINARARHFRTIDEGLKTALLAPDYRLNIANKDGVQSSLALTMYDGKLVGSFDLSRDAFELEDALYAKLEKTPLDFRDRRVLKLDANIVDSARIDRVVYHRKDGEWYTKDSKEAPHMKALVVDLEFAKTEVFLSDKGPVAMGLPKTPKHRLAFFHGDEMLALLMLYSAPDHPDSFYVRKQGDPYLYRIAKKEFEGMKPFSGNDG